MPDSLMFRPHHLLCIQNYVGKGYDDAFTAHMTEIIAMLEQDPEIELVKGCDELCSACPHNRGGECDHAGHVERYDQGVLTACRLAYGECKSWSVLSDIVKEKVFRTEKFEGICSDCQWYGICNSNIVTRTERVRRYERILDRVNRVMDSSEEDQVIREAIMADIRSLEKYYCSPEWKEDYDADAAGLFPANLKRGVLSQDGIDHTLERYRELSERNSSDGR